MTRQPVPLAAIAHRGSSLAHPENTMEAFRAAQAEGADMIELDVRLSRDGQLIVHHDARLSAERLPVDSLTRAELRQLASHVPTLEEVLWWASDRIGVYVELKAEGTAAPTAGLVRSLGMAEQVIAGSFQPGLVEELRAQAPEIPRSVLVRAVDRAGLLRLGSELATRFLHPCWERAAPAPHRLLDAEFLVAVRSAGRGLILWQEDREEELEQLVRLRPAGICTNVPARLVAVRRRLRDEEEPRAA
ncbi:MAG: glycerophosphodiester phosphodiesterase [Acidimicrobiia bacterium]